MKIGILTFHCAHNYGAVLQSFALQEYLKEKGHKVEIIDYRPSYLIEPYEIPSLKLKSLSILRRSLSVILLNNSRVKRADNFNAFIKDSLNLSDETNDVQKEYDLYILGSDQIWNGEITKGIDNVYWGNFIKRADSKICSYAASLGGYKIQKHEKSIIKHHLLNIDKLSVREKETLEEIRSLTSKDIVEVLDPTFLINRSKWDQFLGGNFPKNKYILIYQVRYNKNLLRIANQIANQLQARVIEIPAGISLKHLFNKYKSTSPFEFINLIKNAECIVTSSFHGTAFSLIFEKPFYTVALNDGADNRSINLLSNLSLNNRIINKNSKVDFSHIDYSVVNKKLQDLILSSKSYIESFFYE